MRYRLSVLFALIAGSALAEPSGKLVLYTSQTPEVAQQTVDAFQKKFPAVTVEWTRNGTAQLMNVLRAEASAGQIQADVLLVADTINIGQLKAEGRLLAYPEADLSVYEPSFYDKDRTYFGTKIVATGIAYNTNIAKRPDSWDVLLEPAQKGLVSVPSPLYSGAALAHLHTVISDKSLGWKFYENLKANDTNPVGGNGPALNAVAAGQAKYGIIADGDVMRAKAKGSPVDFIYPKEGVSYITEPVAILKTTKNPEAAKAFVNFLLSEDGEKLVALQGNIPIHPKVASPDGFPPLSKIKLLPLDIEQALAKDGEVKARFKTLFGE